MMPVYLLVFALISVTAHPLSVFNFENNKKSKSSFHIGKKALLKTASVTLNASRTEGSIQNTGLTSSVSKQNKAAHRL